MDIRATLKRCEGQWCKNTAPHWTLIVNHTPWKTITPNPPTLAEALDLARWTLKGVR